MLEVRDLSFSYGDKRVLDNINLTFEKGKLYCIVGRNSAGKSTLVSCLACLVGYDGSITLDGKEISEMSHIARAKRISLLSQSVRAVPFTAGELVSFGRNPYGDIRTKGDALAKKSMEKVGIEHLYGKKVSNISGGERQLSYFAMSLCQNADIMLLDEPTANLDMEYAKRILDISKQKAQEGKTVICVLHNLSDAVRYADEIIVMDKGRVKFSGTKNDCLAGCAIEENFGVKKHTVDGEVFFSV